MLRKLWNDEGGAILSGEIILVMTILVIAMVTGLTSVRDAVVTELADVGSAIASINQSFSYGGIIAHCAEVPGSAWHDANDFCDQGDPGAAFANSRCVAICANVRAECGTIQ